MQRFVLTGHVGDADGVAAAAVGEGVICKKQRGKELWGGTELVSRESERTYSPSEASLSSSSSSSSRKTVEDSLVTSMECP